MGNQPTHAMARLGKLGSAMHDITIEKAPNARLGLNMRNLVVTSIDDGSPAHLHGCGSYIGMRLVCVDGDFVGSAQEVRDKSKGKTHLSVRFIPKELPLVLERRTPTEQLGLEFTNDGVLTGTIEGHCGKRCNADQYIGLKVVTVNQLVVKDMEEIYAACNNETVLHLGFSIPLPEGTALQKENSSASLSLSEAASSLNASTSERVRRDTPPNADAGSPKEVDASYLIKKQARARHSAETTSTVISVVTPNKWSHCNGTYQYDPKVEANGWPVWSRVHTVGPPRFVYSTPHGYWRVTNAASDFATGAGYIITRERHGGSLPHEMPKWQIKREGGYVDDLDIRVTLSITSPIIEALPGATAAVPAMTALGGAAVKEGPGVSSGCAVPEGLPAAGLEVGKMVRVVSGEHVGKGGVVVELVLGDEGRPIGVVIEDDSVARNARSVRVTADARFVVDEPENEAVFMWQEDRQELGLRFENDPTNLTLVSVVALSTAETFNIGRFSRRLLTHVNGTPTRTTSEVKDAVMSAKLLFFRFEPEERLQNNFILTKFISSESSRRRGIIEGEEALALGFVQKVFYLMLGFMERSERELREVQVELAAAIRRAVQQGKALQGVEAASAALVAKQDGIVAGMTHASELCRHAFVAEADHALLATESDARLSGIILPSKRDALQTLGRRLDEHKAASSSAAELSAALKASQTSIDELEVITYTTKRSLACNPDDASLRSTLAATERTILQKREHSSNLVEQLRGISETLPQVLSCILLHDQAK